MGGAITLMLLNNFVITIIIIGIPLRKAENKIEIIARVPS